MNKRFKTAAIAAISSIALAGSIVFAQTTTPDQSNQQGTRTEDQKTKMKQIRENFAAQNKPLREQLRAKRQELRQASEGGTFNEALATQKLTEMASLQAKLMGERNKLHQEMLSVLTAEQKAQLEQSKAQFKARRGERRQRDMQQ
jgi:Spy/CpxP family protein refolding chaperone